MGLLLGPLGDMCKLSSICLFRLKSYLLHISSTLYRKKCLRKPQDDREPDALEFHHYTHEVFFQSLARPRSESSQSGFVILTNHSDIAEGNNTG